MIDISSLLLLYLTESLFVCVVVVRLHRAAILPCVTKTKKMGAPTQAPLSRDLSLTMKGT